MNLQVIPWTHRDGSVHLEMRLCSFFHGTGPDSELITHLDGGSQRFVTACGRPWWGVGSSSGIGHTERVTCEECRALLRSLTFNVEVRDPVTRGDVAAVAEAVKEEIKEPWEPWEPRS